MRFCFRCANQWVRNDDRATLKIRSDRVITGSQTNPAGGCAGDNVASKLSCPLLGVRFRNLYGFAKFFGISRSIARYITRIRTTHDNLVLKPAVDNLENGHLRILPVVRTTSMTVVRVPNWLIYQHNGVDRLPGGGHESKGLTNH